MSVQAITLQFEFILAIKGYSNLYAPSLGAPPRQLSSQQFKERAVIMSTTWVFGEEEANHHIASSVSAISDTAWNVSINAFLMHLFYTSAGIEMKAFKLVFFSVYFYSSLRSHAFIRSGIGFTTALVFSRCQPKSWTNMVYNKRNHYHVVCFSC